MRIIKISTDEKVHPDDSPMRGIVLDMRDWVSVAGGSVLRLPLAESCKEYYVFVAETDEEITDTVRGIPDALREMENGAN